MSLVLASPYKKKAAASSAGRYSALFNGSGDFISSPQTSDFNLWPHNQWTIEAWYYPTSLVDNNSRLMVIQGSNTYGLISSGTRLLFNQFGSGSPIQTATGVIALNAWHHIGLVNNLGVLTLYVNGVNVGTANTAWVSNANTAISFAGNANAFAGTAYGGRISNARIVLDTAVYVANFTVPTEPLTAIPGTTMLTLQDSTFKDNGPNNVMVSVTGSPSLSAVHPFA